MIAIERVATFIEDGAIIISTVGTGSNLKPVATTKTYTVVVERDLESGWLIAEVPALPGCITQAPDRFALLRNVREAIQSYRLATPDDEPLTDYYQTWRVEVNG
jgi:predicted RNase H-like HicB family nuclease